MTSLETILFDKLKDKMQKSGVTLLPDMQSAIEKRSTDLRESGDIEIQARSFKVRESFFYEDEAIDFGFNEAALYMITQISDEIKKGDIVKTIDPETLLITSNIAEHNTEAIFIIRGYFK